MFRFDGEKWIMYQNKITYYYPNVVYTDAVEIDDSWLEVQIEDLELTPEQLKRFEQVQNFENVGVDNLENYVLRGELPEDDTIFLAQIAGKQIEDTKTQIIKDLIDFENTSIDELEKLTFLKKDFRHGIFLEKNDLVEYEGGLYLVNQNHIASEIYPPGKGTEALYTAKRKGTGGDGLEPDPWVKPTHAENAYNIGDRVSYLPDGLIYISQIDGNDTEPTKDAPYNRWWKLDEN